MPCPNQGIALLIQIIKATQSEPSMISHHQMTSSIWTLRSLAGHGQPLSHALAACNFRRLIEEAILLLLVDHRLRGLSSVGFNRARLSLVCHVSPLLDRLIVEPSKSYFKKCQTKYSIPMDLEGYDRVDQQAALLTSDRIYC